MGALGLFLDQNFLYVLEAVLRIWIRIHIWIHRIHMFLGLLDPDPVVRIWIRIRILLSTSKNNKKNLDSYCFVSYFWLFIFKNDVNAPSKSNKQKIFNQKNYYFFAVILKVNEENNSIQIRIRIHWSEAWIRGSRSGSTPKCHGSATLPRSWWKENLFIVVNLLSL